jgi:hypothetical protein
MNPKELLEKLPLVAGWIDRALAEHGPRARSVASYRFPRLGGFYSEQLLSAARVVAVDQVPAPPLSSFGLVGFEEFENGNYAGITFGDTYFARSDQALSESLHFHELVHVVQWRHLGPERFLVAYATGFLQGGGYRGNPLERMAYSLQEHFEKGRPPMDVESAVRRQLDAVMARMPNAG